MSDQNCAQIYQSTTTWQAEYWEVEVKFGSFSTIEEAADFGASKIKRLIHEPNANHLILIDDLGHYHRIEQKQVNLYKLKVESQNKLMISREDFILVELRIEEFSCTEGLNSGFGFQSYGVSDKDDCPVSLYLFT